MYMLCMYVVGNSYLRCGTHVHECCPQCVSHNMYLVVHIKSFTLQCGYDVGVCCGYQSSMLWSTDPEMLSMCCPQHVPHNMFSTTCNPHDSTGDPQHVPTTQGTTCHVVYDSYLCCGAQIHTCCPQYIDVVLHNMYPQHRGLHILWTTTTYVVDISCGQHRYVVNNIIYILWITYCGRHTYIVDV